MCDAKNTSMLDANMRRICEAARRIREAQLATDKIPNLCIAHTRMLIAALSATFIWQPMVQT